MQRRAAYDPDMKQGRGGGGKNNRQEVCVCVCVARRWGVDLERKIVCGGTIIVFKGLGFGGLVYVLPPLGSVAIKLLFEQASLYNIIVNSRHCTVYYLYAG
jgi:hypothetical protein